MAIMVARGWRKSCPPKISDLPVIFTFASQNTDKFVRAKAFPNFRLTED
jgi:hypothetical protein